MQLNATIRQRNETNVVRLSGVLDEGNKLLDLVAQVETLTTLINLSAVERINARGVKDWMAWLAALEAKGIQPVLVACSPAVVEQLNSVPGFVGHGLVKSFQAPYHCPKCNAKKLLVVHVSDVIDNEAPACACDECTAAMKFDAVPETYFAFVATVEHSLSRASDPQIGDSAPDLARGSAANAGPVRSRTKSRPSLANIARTSSPSFTKIETGPMERVSQQNLLGPAGQPAAPSERPYLFVIVALLCGAIAVLAYLVIR